MREIINIITEASKPRSPGAGRYKFSSRCVEGPHGPNGEAIHDMTDRAKPITYDQFERAVGRDQLRQVFPRYDWTGSGGLELRNDRLASKEIYASKWRGIPCVYMVHSAIEYIFTLDGRKPDHDHYYDR